MGNNLLPPYVDILIECDPVDYARIKKFCKKWHYDTAEKSGCILAIVVKRCDKESAINILKSIGIKKYQAYYVVSDKKRFKEVCKDLKL